MPTEKAVPVRSDRTFIITIYLGRPENPAALRSASASSSLPSSMTTRVCHKSPMRVEGSPSTSARSAAFPTFTEPVFASWPTSRAGTMVAAASASAALNPACT